MIFNEDMRFCQCQGLAQRSSLLNGYLDFIPSADKSSLWYVHLIPLLPAGLVIDRPMGLENGGIGLLFYSKGGVVEIEINLILMRGVFKSAA